MQVRVENPLLRTPLSIIIDDSCPVINKAKYWIEQREAWRVRHGVTAPRNGWERHYDKLDRMPDTIPASFAEEWGDWCGEQGIRGKFSMIPFPAGVGRIDQTFVGFPERELSEWIRVARDVIQPHFDLTPEMITHTHVVDLDTWQLTEEWEQGEWVDPPAELLPRYVETAMQLLRNAGIVCEGVTSPGAFAKRKEDVHAKAVLDGARRVNGIDRPFYFLHMVDKEMPTVPIWYADKSAGTAVASIVGCAGDWFGATGFDEASADRFITEDLRGGRLPEVLEAGAPCVLVGHWPCFYVNDQVGFGVLRDVKRRLDAYDPDGTRTLWMKNSEIGHYWMARELSNVSVAEGASGGEVVVTIETAFPTPDFTLSVDAPARRVRVDGSDLRSAGTRQAFRAGSYLAEGSTTALAFDLAVGRTDVIVTLD